MTGAFDACPIALDMAPGRVFNGEIVSVGFAVNWDNNSQAGNLQTVSASRGWLRSAQRFPVIVRFSDDASLGLRKGGGQADVIVYTGSGLMGREIENIRTCDMVVLVGGRSGTLGEFAIAYDEAKIIGALTGTGGITDKLQEIISFIHKDTGAKVVYADDPIDLVDKLASLYEKELLPYYRTVLANSSPDGILES